MARETDYTVVYRAAADFSALAREAAKARAILKAMREEEEKANKAVLQDQDRIEKARTRARKALEAQNMAATTAARISREMVERGKKEAETVRSLASGSEAAARQITKLAEAYKKLNSATSGETTSSSAKTINEKTSFAAVSARELEKVKNNLTAYIASANNAGDSNNRLTGSFKNIQKVTSDAGDILARLTATTKKQNDSTTEVTVSTRNYGNVVETTTRRLINAGTEAERVVTTIRRVTKETETAGTRLGSWAGGLARNFRIAWREADEGVSVLGKLRRATSGGGGGGNTLDRLTTSAEAFGRAGSNALRTFNQLPRVLRLGIGIAAIFEPAVAILGTLGAVALGAANNVAVLSGALAALPGFLAAGAVAAGALFTAFSPVAGIFKQYASAQKEAQTASSSAGRTQRDNSQQIASALRAQRNAQESLTDANRNLRRAQEDLNEAWRDAKKDLADLREEVSRGAEDEEGAEIALARAKERQIEINKTLNSSNLDRREAAHDVREAEAALADVRKQNKENQDELNQTEKSGLKNSEQVIRAQENLTNAQRQARNAELDLIDSKKSLAEARKVEMTGAAATTTQQDRYRQMLEKLSPSTRKFVEQILGMEGAWKKIQRATGESFFKHLVDDQKRFNALLPIGNDLLTRAADALGKVADRGLAMVTSGPWKADFAKLSKDNAVLIENMGDAGLSIADAFRHIVMAAAPFTKWVSIAIKDGAAGFAAWAKEARANGTIARFLDDTKARMQQLWRITKDVFASLNSWNTASNDFGKWLLDRIELMTGRWRDNAKAQEENGSKLKKYLEDVRPLLTALGSLVGAVAAGFAAMAADPENMASTIKLLSVLEQDVLPPLLRLLDELNDSGIAITVADALGRIFDALDQFLEAGGGQAISKFVETFADVVSLVIGLASAGGVAPVLAGIASTLAVVAGAALAAKFLGLFKLIEVFKWLLTNGRAVANRFRDVGDGINSTTTTTTGGPVTPGGGATPPAGGFSRATKPSAISAGDLAAVQKNVANYTLAAQGATTQSGRFSRALDGVKNASGGLRRGLGGVTDFLGGPWGIALTAAAIGLAYFSSQQDKVKAKADSYVAALQGMSQSQGDAANSMKDLSAEALRANPDLAEMVNQMRELGFTADEIKLAFNGSSEEVAGAIDKINKAIKETENSKIDPSLVGPFIGDRTFNKDAVERIEKLQALKKALEENKITNKDAAKAIKELGLEQKKTSDSTEKFAEKVRISTFDMSIASEQIKTIDDVLNVLGDSTSTAAQRFEALKTAAGLLSTEADKNADADENWAEKLVSLSESVEANGKSLGTHSREGLNNRKALKDATLAARDHTLELIASGTPYDVAIKKHKERITELKKEAHDAGLSEQATADLIARYDKIPGEKETMIKATGFDAVYQQLRELQWAQVALKFGMDPADAAAEFKRMEAARKGAYPQGSGSAGLKPNTTQKKAMGGAIYGPGSKTSDDIEARLSNGEFVQKADAVSYYGTDLMYALNNQMIDKSALRTAQKVSSRKGGLERVDPMYAEGGEVQRFASGGSVKFPFEVGLQKVVPAAKKLFGDWKQDNMAVGGGGDASIGGWKNMWNWVKTRFPFTSLMSAYRPGDPLYHGKGKAIDIGVPDKFGTGRWWSVFNGIKSTFFKNIAELIWDFAGNKAVWNGQEHFFHGPKSGPGTHRNHIHFAMKNPGSAFKPGKSFQRDNADRLFAGGGLVDYMNFGGLPTPSAASVPNSTASLSRAARSVVNQNTTNSGLSIGEININNPMQERGGDSIRNSLLRTAMLFDGP